MTLQTTSLSLQGQTTFRADTSPSADDETLMLTLGFDEKTHIVIHGLTPNDLDSIAVALMSLSAEQWDRPGEPSQITTELGHE